MIVGLDETEVTSRFEALQRKLVPQWEAIGSLNQLEQTMVVVPSISTDFHAPTLILQAYEERMLFLLLLLRKPRMRIVYVTSQPILPSVIDYYMGLLPGVIGSHARKRFFEVTALDGTDRPLSQKLLERPRVLERIRSLISNPEQTHLVPYNTTDLEKELAVQLGIPMYGADPKFFPLGTKTGSRRLFAEEEVPHPLGIEDLRGMADVRAAIQHLRRHKPALKQLVVKLNEGISGEGNAFLRLEGLPAPGAPNEPGAIDACLHAMEYELPSVTFESFMTKMAARGGVVEERVTGTEVLSPSVQLRNTPLGNVELLSTHDQLLGGHSGQSYLGCVFPADASYAPLITREAAKVGRRLAREGVLGRYALDFVVVRSPGEKWRVYAIEVNLRKGGTTHPFLTLQFLTDGVYDPETATFHTPSGKAKHYVANDHVESPRYRAFAPDDLFDIAVRHNFHFNQSTQTGVVFHMMAALSEQGRLGMTVIADSAPEAEALYKKVIDVLDAEA